jgi:hypothetical protein
VSHSIPIRLEFLFGQILKQCWKAVAIKHLFLSDNSKNESFSFNPCCVVTVRDVKMSKGKGKVDPVLN